VTAGGSWSKNVISRSAHHLKINNRETRRNNKQQLRLVVQYDCPGYRKLRNQSTGFIMQIIIQVYCKRLATHYHVHATYHRLVCIGGCGLGSLLCLSGNNGSRSPDSSSFCVEAHGQVISVQDRPNRCYPKVILNGRICPRMEEKSKHIAAQTSQHASRVTEQQVPKTSSDIVK
jgi:hypothetical protein